MSGITSYGAYIPPTRLSFNLMSGRPARENGPEKAVAWSDEDSVTMAVAAGASCLESIDRSCVDSVLFASTTNPFREKQAASLIAKALDLRRDVRTADLGGSLRAGTGALRMAADAVAAGTSRNVLVLASDCRMAAPGSALERNLGDGAAAFLVSESKPIAVFEDFFSVADEIVDVWRGAEDRFVHSWEERFVIQEGYLPTLCEVVTGLLGKSGTSLEEFAKVVLYGPDARSHATAARKLRIAPERLQEPFFGVLGNTGVAFASLQLAAALESAKPGDSLLLASYGDGAEALSLRVGESIEKLDERRGVSWHLARRRPLTSYDHYLKARSLSTTEWDGGSDPGLSATIHFRERDEDLSFKGQQCRSCKAIQFPLQRVCETCFRRDDFDLVRLSDRRGRVVTYTFDFFFPTPEPPTIVTVTEVDGGARVHLQLVNATPEQTRTGLPVEFVFRRIHQVGGRPNYYWKASAVMS